MNAMDRPRLSNYLAGSASDKEIQRCEAFLNDPDNAPDCDVEGDLGLEELGTDSLIDTLQNLGGISTVAQIDDLVEKIQGLVPRRSIGPDELERVLGPAESDSEMGRIGGYRVIEFIASGGMGLVFKAEDLVLGRLVCIKILHPMIASHRDSNTRFARESKAAAGLRNDRIVTVHDVGEHRNLPFLVMQLLDGESLRDRLTHTGRLEPAVAKGIAIQIAEGLRYAHEVGYLHRDIKPENIWITTEGDVKLLDFGLARIVNETTNLTATGTIIGTPSYMSPEQVQGNDLDARSDLFSLGTVLFEMLTGISPFEKSNLFSTMMSVANDSLEFPKSTAPNNIPVQLIPILESLLKKSPDERIESADHLITALESIDEHSQVAVPRVARTGMNRGLIGLMGGLAGAACLAFALFLYQLNDKGTLVIEADPSINVSIVNETIAIHDPKTEKDFAITIGDHPLRSGVYQLEMLDASGEYTLSSNVIVIHRGKKQVVRIELKPTPRTPKTGDSSTAVTARSATKSKIILAEVPTLDATELQRKLNISSGSPLARNAMVSQPTPRDQVRSWTIESKYYSWSSKNNVELNSDGSLIATMNPLESMVRIWNRKGELAHLIPVQDIVQQIRWSPDSNIIAVIENGDLRKQVTVWKLFDDHVEAIDVIATDALELAWSWDGLLLALQGENEMSFVDVSKGSIFAHPNFGITGKMSEHPWSFDRRYFATSVEGSVKVWDLEQRKIFHIFASSEEARFLPTANKIAVKKDSGEWEVWDLVSFERESILKPDSNWLAAWPDHQFERLAAFSSDGRLIVKNLLTGEQSAHESGAEPQYLSAFRWSEDGGSYVCRFQNGALVSASFPKGPSHTDANRVEHERFAPMIRGVIRYGRRTQVLERSSNNRIVYFNDFDDQKPGFLSSLELNTLEYFPSPDFQFYEHGASYRISPDGTLVAIIGSGMSPSIVQSESDAEKLARMKQWNDDLASVRVCSLATGKLRHTFKLDSQIQNLHWSPDSESLVVSSVIDKTMTPMASLRDKNNQIAGSYLRNYDLDNDGKLNKLELLEMRRPIPGSADRDSDGFVSLSELIDHLSKEKSVPEENKEFMELEIKVFSLSTGTSFVLQPGKVRDEKQTYEYCFQRSRSKRIGDVASPVLLDGQIVVPLFDADTYPASGVRMTSRGRGNASSSIRQSTSGRKSIVERELPGDKLGFFDLKSGRLNEVVELGQRFEGDQLAINERMIMVGGRSDTNRNTIDSWVVIARSGRDKTGDPARLIRIGRVRSNAYLSPGNSFVALLYSRPGQPNSYKTLEFWKIDLKGGTSQMIKRFNFQKTGGQQTKRQLAWHPTEPVFAWTDGKTIRWFNAKEEKLTFSDGLRSVRGIIGTADGWLVAGRSKMVEFDSEFKVSKTYFPSQPISDFDSVSPMDQAISTDGKIMVDATKANLRAVQLRGNRIETLTIEAFEAQSK